MADIFNDVTHGGHTTCDLRSDVHASCHHCAECGRYPGAYGEVVQRNAASLVELMNLSDAELRAMQTAAEHRARTLFDTGVMARSLVKLIDERLATPRQRSTHVSLDSYLTALRYAAAIPALV